MSVPVDEFDGKVVYGDRRKKQGYKYFVTVLKLILSEQALTTHAVELSGVVKALNDLERSVQLSYLSLLSQKL